MTLVIYLFVGILQATSLVLVKIVDLVEIILLRLVQVVGYCEYW